MNFVGKIFIFLNLLLSIAFMCFAVAVYATHRNWRAEFERTAAELKPGEQLGMIHRLEAAKKMNEDLKNEFEKYQAQVEMEKKQTEQNLSKLESKRAEAQAELDTLKKEHGDLVEKDKQALATLATTQQNLEKLTAEVEKLRQEIRDTQHDRDKQFNLVVQLTDDKHQLQNQIARLTERNVQLAAQSGRYKLALFNRGFPEGVEPSGVAPPLKGRVLDVNQDDMIEISLGSDDGLQTGHTVEVFRDRLYLGRAEILSIEPDRAVAKLQFKKGAIQKGDNVTTRFKVG